MIRRNRKSTHENLWSHSVVNCAKSFQFHLQFYSGWRLYCRVPSIWLQMRFILLVSPDSLTHLGWKMFWASAFCFTFYSYFKLNDLWTFFVFSVSFFFGLEWRGLKLRSIEYYSNSSCNLNISLLNRTPQFSIQKLSIINFFKNNKHKFSIINHRDVFVWLCRSFFRV